MSWQEEYIARYEARLVEEWAVGGGRILSNKTTTDSLSCDRCNQTIKLGESWERDIHQAPFDLYESEYGATRMFVGFARHTGECPNNG